MSGRGRYLSVLIGLSAAVLILAPFQAQVNSTTVALALLIVVLVSASVFGSGPGYFAAVLGVLSFNYFFLPPLYTFTIADPQNWVALAAFLTTAVVAGQLSSYARRRAAESESRRQEIERLYEELRGAFEKASQAEALRQSEQLKSSLLDAVTHDLRTPLTSIKASVTTLIEGTRPRSKADGIVLGTDEQNGLLEIINDETDRLNEFIGGIVDLARLEAGKTDTRRSWCDVRGIIDAAIERCRHRLHDHDISIVVEEELPAVRVDAGAVGEVVFLFLDNAAKYSPSGSQIRLSAKRSENETIQISVEDQGPGIEKELRNKIFEKFYRIPSDDIHSTGSGMGVGLAIARGMADSQGGRVWVDNGTGEFKTKFVFQFPVGDDEGEKPQQGLSEDARNANLI